MRYEIRRNESCRPGHWNMYQWTLHGRSQVGTVTTDHSASSYGQPVVLVEAWGGFVDYSDIKEIHIISDGESADEMVKTFEGLQSKLAPFGINVSW